MKVSAKLCPTRKSSNHLCFVTLTRFPLAVWVLNNGGWHSLYQHVRVCGCYFAKFCFWHCSLECSGVQKCVSLVHVKTREVYSLLYFLSSCSVGLWTLNFGEYSFFVFSLRLKIKRDTTTGFRWTPVIAVLNVFVASVVHVGRWLVGFLASVVPGWWKGMPSSTSSSENASYQLIVVGFWSELLLLCRLESGCRPVVWCFVVSTESAFSVDNCLVVVGWLQL